MGGTCPPLHLRAPANDCDQAGPHPQGAGFPGNRAGRGRDDQTQQPSEQRRGHKGQGLGGAGEPKE